MFHVLGIRAIAKRIAEFDYEYPRFLDPPLASIESASEINENFLISKLEYFDFSHMVNLYYEQKDKVLRQSLEDDDRKISLLNLSKRNEFIAMGSFNSLFMICSYLRGMDRFLMDMAGNKKLAEKIVKLASQYCLEYNRLELENFGPQAEFYCSWDDVATQQDLFFSPEDFKRYFLPFYQELIAEVKKYNLFFDWHCCGNVNKVLPLMIDAGIDIFDVVQTSAKDMNLEKVYKNFGNSVCLHGGMDVQKLLFKGSRAEVRREVKKVIELWADKGGIILSPSHECMPGTPAENIIEIYLAVNEYSGT